MEKNGIEKNNLEKGGLNESKEKVDNTTDQNPPETPEKADDIASKEVRPVEEDKNEQTKVETGSVKVSNSDVAPIEGKTTNSQSSAEISNKIPEDPEGNKDTQKEEELKNTKIISEEEHGDHAEPSKATPEEESKDAQRDFVQSSASDETPVEDKSIDESLSAKDNVDQVLDNSKDVAESPKEHELKEPEELPKDNTTSSDGGASYPVISETQKEDVEPEQKKPVSTEQVPAQDADSSDMKQDDVKGESDQQADDSEEHEEAHLDYSNYSKKQMVQVLESLLKEDDFSQVGRILKEIKKPFDILSSKERKEAFEKYIEDGGEKDGFEYRLDELDQRFHAAYGKLRERKNQYYNSLEKQKEQNLKIKQDILEKLRELVDSEETGTSIKAIKDLQKQWKEVGVIASAQVKSLWANYNALLDRFYDQRSIYFELKELDRKKNYDLKIELCVKAEALVDQENIREVIKHLNELHEEFKHIGPVPNDVQEAVWERFKAASDKIYSRRKDYYEKLKGEFKLNEVAKEALIEKVTPFAEFQSDRISDWNAKTKEVIAIQKEWEAIGSLPKEKAKSINKRFWSAFKSFFHKKGQFFKKIEDERRENLKLKEELVEKAEALKESDDFRKTSDELKKLQRRWKEIGPVPEKFRNEVYLKFKKSCDHFFDRRRANSGKIEKDYEENLVKKQALCDELEKMVKNDDINIDRVKSVESEWAEIGFVPKSNIKSIQKRYADVISTITDKADIPDSEKHKMRFSAQFSNINYGPGAEKLIYKKEGALRRQISALENDISLWKNNMDFFASSKNADKLKEEFQVKIDKATDQLMSLKEQLKVIVNI